MSDSKTPQQDDVNKASKASAADEKWADIANESTQSAESADEAGEAEVENIHQASADALEAAQAKAQAHWDKAMHLAAELENVRKRAQRDATHARKFALEKFANELLPVVDSLERGAEVASDASTQVDAMREGMQLTLKLFLETLARFDIRQVDPAGEAFDPNFHEAMSTVEDAEVPHNHVVQVLQKGYVLSDRVLRPALVVVSKAAKS